MGIRLWTCVLDQAGRIRKHIVNPARRGGAAHGYADRPALTPQRSAWLTRSSRVDRGPVTPSCGGRPKRTPSPKSALCERISRNHLLRRGHPAAPGVWAHHVGSRPPHIAGTAGGGRTATAARRGRRLGLMIRTDALELLSGRSRNASLRDPGDISPNWPPADGPSAIAGGRRHLHRSARSATRGPAGFLASVCRPWILSSRPRVELPDRIARERSWSSKPARRRRGPEPQQLPGHASALLLSARSLGLGRRSRRVRRSSACSSTGSTSSEKHGRDRARSGRRGQLSASSCALRHARTRVHRCDELASARRNPAIDAIATPGMETSLYSPSYPKVTPPPQEIQPPYPQKLQPALYKT